jgi:hypothetical protein
MTAPAIHCPSFWSIIQIERLSSMGLVCLNGLRKQRSPRLPHAVRSHAMRSLGDYKSRSPAHLASICVMEPSWLSSQRPGSAKSEVVAGGDLGFRKHCSAVG